MMNEIQKPSIQSRRFNTRLAETIAILVWLYLIIKFVFIDFDILIIQKYFPEMEWLIKYKFFILSTLVVILWLLFKGGCLLKLIGYIIGYPFYLIFWRIPRFLFKTKDWVGVFAALEIIIPFFRKFKLNFAVFTFVCISGLLILATSTPYTLVPSISILGAFLIIHFIGRFKYALQPFNTLTFQSTALTRIWRWAQEAFRVGKIKEVKEKMDKEETDTTWATNLQFVLIINKVCYFLISKLRNFKRSKTAFLYSFLIIIGSVFITILIFSFLNYALFKLLPDSFSNFNSSSFRYFIYYSFNTLFHTSINVFYPIGDWAHLLYSAEVFFGFLIFVVLVTLVTTILRERHSEQIDGVINAIDEQAKSIDNFIKDEYRLTPSQALKEVEKIKGAMLKIIYYLINNS